MFMQQVVIMEVLMAIKVMVFIIMVQQVIMQ